MVRRAIRIAILVWLIGAGVQWAQRNQAAVRRIRAMVGGMTSGGGSTARRMRGAARRSKPLAREQLFATAQRKAETGGQGEGAPSAAAIGDDLKIIEGIGPRIDGVLTTAGVTTFQQLAELTSGRIATIIREAGVSMSNPASWPEQARLAASGEWDALAEMQAHLKRGRDVTRS